MVGARRAHRVGGDHVPLGARGVAQAREAAVEHRRRGGGRRSEERGRKGRRPADGDPASPVAPDRLGIRRKGMARSPGTARVRKGASARISSIDSRTNGTLFVTLRSGRRRRPGSRGIPGYRDGEEDHDGGNDPPEEGAWHAAFMEMIFVDSFCPPAVVLPRPWESCGNGSPYPPWGEADLVLSRSLISGIVSFE